MQDHPRRAGRPRRAFLALAAASLGGAALGARPRAAGPEPGAPAGWDGPDRGHVVPAWNRLALRAEGGARDPLVAGRTLAMMHLAMHDAANAAVPRFATFLPVPQRPGADPGLAAAAAAHGVLRAAWPGEARMFDAALATLAAEAGPGEATTRALGLGAEAARAILADRDDDGAGATLRYGPLTHLGAWRYTPGVEAMRAPHWARLRPFVLPTPRALRVAPPPPVESAAHARALAEVKALGARDSGRRTAEQARIARFWSEEPVTAWNRIARAVAREGAPGLWDAARLFALVNLALADGHVAAWDSKLHHDAWRPQTAIALAGVDFNDATTPAPGWEPLLPNPPFQAHPSAHATLGAAAAAVLAGLLGDATPFAIGSATASTEEPVRRLPGFTAAARETAESRILAGLQFRFGVEAGLGLGARIGRLVLAERLRPLEPGWAIW